MLVERFGTHTGGYASNVEKTSFSLVAWDAWLLGIAV
jgi:hypothetical protein